MSEVLIPIGPQHPALKEPVSLRGVPAGGVIKRLERGMSYNPGGIEKAAGSGDFVKVVPLRERVCGICSHSHATAFVKGIEEVMGLTVPRRGPTLRPRHRGRG